MKTLYLLPNLLNENAPWSFTPPPIGALIAESEKGGYRYCKRFGVPAVPTYLLNEHTRDLKELLAIPEESVGLISDAGMPCLADPGAALVYAARRQGVAIHAFPGPSSILLALVLSGFSAQSFTFHGYLDPEREKLERQIRGFSPGMTHIFIETPYRNRKLLEILLSTLKPDDLLCVAWDLTGPKEGVLSKPVREWKEWPDIHKVPAVFLAKKGQTT